MSLKVKVEGSFCPGMMTVTFDANGREYVYLMDEALAKTLETRLNCMWQFKHGILRDGSLTAMFKDAGDRNAALFGLNDGHLEAFDAELV